ncbi:MAG: efflux RND transporter periplasmic adaptor subunit [Chryseolinea sp.]
MRRSLSFNPVDSFGVKVGGAMVLLLTFTLLFFSCKKETASHDVYTCPMHPTVTSNKPGACPVCHMDLVKKVAGAEVVIDEELAAAAASPNEQVLSSVRTVRGNFTALPVSIVRTGVVTYDSRNSSVVSVRVSGRLEKIYVRYLYQHVRKGEKIADIYSPELVAAQREMLQVRRSDPGNESLISAARERLFNLGMTTKQIDDIVARDEPQYTVSIYSQSEGIVVQRSGQAPAAPTSTPPEGEGMNTAGAMNASTPTQTTSLPLATRSIDLPREGTYVSAGQPLFEIISFSSVVLEINLPPTASGNVRKGDNIEVAAGNTKLSATIDLLQPFTQSGDQFIKVRAYVSDTKSLLIGQLITARLVIPSVEGLWLPTSAIYDLGTRKIAFVKKGRHFSPVEVETGPATDKEMMVISGVASADEVAAEAQFLIDNEGFIKTH